MGYGTDTEKGRSEKKKKKKDSSKVLRTMPKDFRNIKH